MPERERPDLEFSFDASNALDAQATRIRRRLQKLAERLARRDFSRADHLHDVVEKQHVLRAAKAFLGSDRTWYALVDPGHDVFLCYSTSDQDFARELKADLRVEGVKCFLAALSVEPGSAWRDRIWRALRGCRVFVPVVTEEAVRSEWCLGEIGAALGLGKHILAVLRHRSQLPDLLKTIQAKRVQTKAQQAALVRQLKKLCSS